MRSMLGLGTLLLLLLPRVGGAREVWGQQPRAHLSLAPVATVGAAPGGDLSHALHFTDDTVEEARKKRGAMADRIGMEVILGGGFGVSGAFFGGILGMGFHGSNDSCVGDTCALNVFAHVGEGAAVGIAIAAPFGVYLGGNLMHGRGMLLPTLVGSAVGMGLVAWPPSRANNVSSAGALALLLSPLAGSILGYEVSGLFASEKGRSEPASQVQVFPAAGVTASGTGVFGLAGRL